MDNEYALEIQQLTVNYEKTPVLWDISLKVPKGKCVAVIGPNGAGKSTFLKSCLGFVKPLSGKISFWGTALEKVKKQIAYVPQKELIDWDFPLTVFDLVMMGAYGRLGLFRRPRKRDKRAVLHYLKEVEMQDFAHRQIGQLSGGQQQRIFIARALLQEADVYFLDEPLAGIDIASSGIIVRLLQQLTKLGKTVFMVHHDLETVKKYFNWVILLNLSLVACGEVEKVFTLENIQQAYGKENFFLDQVAKLSQRKTTGYSA